MRWNGRGELVCPLRGQSSESRLAAQRSVLRAQRFATNGPTDSGLGLDECASCEGEDTRVEVQHRSSGRGCQAISPGSWLHLWPAGGAVVNPGPIERVASRGVGLKKLMRFALWSPLYDGAVVSLGQRAAFGIRGIAPTCGSASRHGIWRDAQNE